MTPVDIPAVGSRVATPTRSWTQVMKQTNARVMSTDQPMKELR